jgi:hypothetical protein
MIPSAFQNACRKIALEPRNTTPFRFPGGVRFDLSAETPQREPNPAPAFFGSIRLPKGHKYGNDSGSSPKPVIRLMYYVVQ